MKAQSIAVVTLIAATLAAPAPAQQSGAGSGAAKPTAKTTAPTAAAKVQPELVTVHAAGYNEANKASYTAAFDAIIPEALRLVTEAKTRAERPRH